MILTVVTANQGQTYIKGENNKVKWVGKIFQKMEVNPRAIRYCRKNRGHLHDI